MENASEALKMAGAMLLFIMALSVTIMTFSKVREASGSVMSNSDNMRTFYDIENPLSEREVQVDTVIAKLYNAYQSQDTVVFYTGTKNGSQITNVKPMPLYYTEALDKNTKNDTSTVLKDSKLVLDSQSGGENKRAIFGIDLSDELLRDEPWQSNNRQKTFIDALVNRKPSPQYSSSRNLINTSRNTEYTLPDENGNIIDRGYRVNFWYTFDGKNSLLNCRGKFVERVGLYNTDSVTSQTDNRGTDTSSSEISFDEIDDTIQNEDGTVRKIIQYIYIG